MRHTHAVLRQVLEQAVEWKLILRNPADLLKRKLPKVSEAERRVLDETEAAGFLKVCNGETARADLRVCTAFGNATRRIPRVAVARSQF